MRVGLLGSKGRMGQWVAKLLKQEFPGLVLAVESDRGSALATLMNVDVVIDFSSPDAVLTFVQLCREQTGMVPALVVGSTGWTQAQWDQLAPFASRSAVLRSANFSEGMGLLLEILRKNSPAFVKLGYRPIIRETHHVHKKDSPSGTAIALQKAIRPSNPEQVETLSFRTAEVIGDHEVTFSGKGDRIILSHSAEDRSIFARGAIRTAIWLHKKHSNAEFGLFEMQDYYEDL